MEVDTSANIIIITAILLCLAPNAVWWNVVTRVIPQLVIITILLHLAPNVIRYIVLGVYTLYVYLVSGGVKSYTALIVAS